ncbi:MAG: cardiolipin synthase [Spirochaetota bacterium]
MVSDKKNFTWKSKTHQASINTRITYDYIIKKIKNRFFLPHFLRSIKKYGISGFYGGNKVILITDGDVFFDELFKAVDSARFTINLETYIFNSDDIGWKLAKKLAAKAKKGIEVNVIYDAIGCINTSSLLFEYMHKMGIELIEYHPIVPWRKYFNLYIRDHRKLMVIDGRIAFTGGMNIGNEYAGKKYRGQNWRDTHIKIEGPVVKDIEYFFLENWHRQGGALVDISKYFPVIKPVGDTIVMALSSHSRRRIKPIYQTYLAAIVNARNYIYITNAYFIPDMRIVKSLIHAAKKGVDVRILLPAISDIPFVQHASRYLYKRFLKNNVRIYEYKHAVLHAKTAVIDDIWATVGSSNLDRRSFTANLEVNAIILDQSFGEKMKRQFLKDIKTSEEIHLEHYKRRPFVQYLKEWLCYRFRYLL